MREAAAAAPAAGALHGGAVKQCTWVQALVLRMGSGLVSKHSRLPLPQLS